MTQPKSRPTQIQKKERTHQPEAVAHTLGPQANKMSPEGPPQPLILDSNPAGQRSQQGGTLGVGKRAGGADHRPKGRRRGVPPERRRRNWPGERRPADEDTRAEGGRENKPRRERRTGGTGGAGEGSPGRTTNSTRRQTRRRKPTREPVPRRADTRARTEREPGTRKRVRPERVRPSREPRSWARGVVMGEGVGGITRRTGTDREPVPERQGYGGSGAKD